VPQAGSSTIGWVSEAADGRPHSSPSFPFSKNGKQYWFHKMDPLIYLCCPGD
jgi:hypothetical protein